MYRSIALSILIVAIPQASTFLFGGGCCGAPVIQSPCCQSTSWAYAPPQVIGYERIPLYAKVPMPPPPPPPSYVRSRPAPRVIVQSQPYYPSPPPPPPPPPPASSYYQSPAPMDNMAPAPSSSSVSNNIPSVIPPPQDKYNDGDVIIIETDDSRRRRMSPHVVQPPPVGYVSQPVAPQGYEVQPQQQQQFIGQVENGVEVTPDQIHSGYQPQQQLTAASESAIQPNFGSQSTGFVDTVASSAAYEATGIAPSARRLRKFKN